MTETQLVKAILERAARLYYGKLFLWRNNTGAVRYENRKGNNRFVKFGCPGSPDLIGMSNDGRFVGIECKVGKGKQTALQKDFEQKVLAMNGIYILARQQEDLDLIFER